MTAPCRMRRLASGFVRALFLLALGVPASSELPQHGTLRVGVDPAYPPHQFADRQGRPAGFDVDLFRAVAREAGLDFEFELVAWPELRARLESGDLDLCPGVFHTEYRAERLAFTVPTAWVNYQIFVREGSPARERADLDGAEILVNRDGFHHQLIRDSNLPVVALPANGSDDVLRRLAAGEGDAAVVPDTQGLYWIRELGLSKVRSLGEPLQTLKLRFAVPIAKADLIGELNDALVGVRESGEYDRLYDEWFGVLKPHGVPLSSVLALAGAALTVAGVLSLGAWLWSRSLQAEVTRRTRELIETDTKLRATFAAARNVSLFVAEAPGDDARIVEWSEGSARTLGYSRDEALAMRVGDLRSPDDREQYGSLLGTRAGDGARSRDAELRRSDGGTFPAFVVSAMLPHGQGEAARLLYVAFDLSERAQAEREKQELERKLAQAQKMDALGRLAGGVAHDFKNVLTAILGNAELASRALPDEPTVRENLDEIGAAGRSATQIIDQLLTFSRREEGAPVITSWNEVIEGVDTMLRRLVASPIQLTIRKGENPWPIRVDVARGAQVVLNLAINARDAVDRAGRVEISTESETRDGEDWAVLIVRDDGSGIGEAVRARMFEPFFTTKADGEGTGLGLATVYGIVEEAGGRIEVESKPGEGACIRVAFPRAKP